MVLPLIASTFSTIFLAELGDKTQLATVSLSSTTNKPLAVFIGSSTALLLASLIGVIAGGSMATFIPTELLQLIAGLGFITIGVKLLWPIVLMRFNPNE